MSVTMSQNLKYTKVAITTKNIDTHLQQGVLYFLVLHKNREV